MALIAYDDGDAAAFAATRHLSAPGLDAWRLAVGRHLNPGPGVRLLDLGSGTGSWSRAFRTWWPRMSVLAVEPSAAMRARTVHRPVVAGRAEEIPLRDDTVDGVWLSTVVHHVPDLTMAAGEVRRVLRPGAPVLIRSAFAGRHDGIALFRFFPEAVAILDRYRGVAEVEAAFSTAGFTRVGVEAVPQVTAPSLGDVARHLRRAAHTPLQLISDEAYAAGLHRLRAAAAVESGPVVDHLDLLVLR